MDRPIAKVTAYIVIIFAAIGFVVLMFYAERNLNWYALYKDRTEEAIKRLVKSECLR